MIFPNESDAINWLPAFSQFFARQIQASSGNEKTHKNCKNLEHDDLGSSWPSQFIFPPNYDFPQLVWCDKFDYPHFNDFFARQIQPSSGNEKTHKNCKNLE